DTRCHVTELIGFAGEGKSSLARRWLDGLLGDRSQPQPDGVFWWGFYEKPNTAEFFEAALTYLTSGKMDLRLLASTEVRVQIIGAMLGAGRYLFILDGLEVLQHQEGDQFGLLADASMRDFLGYIAAPEHNSFCVIT